MSQNIKNMSSKDKQDVTVPIVLVKEKKYVSTLKGLAISQMIFGSLILLFAHISFMILSVQNMYGVEPLGGVSGLWIILTGIIGLLSFKKEQHYCLNGTYLGFCIISCIFALVNVAFFSIRLVNLKNGYYDNWMEADTVPSQALAGIVLFISSCEFGVALAASICCCVYQLCCPRSSYECYAERLLLPPFHETAASAYDNPNITNDGNLSSTYTHRNYQIQSSNSEPPTDHGLAYENVFHTNNQCCNREHACFNQMVPQVNAGQNHVKTDNLPDYHVNPPQQTTCEQVSELHNPSHQRDLNKNGM